MIIIKSVLVCWLLFDYFIRIGNENFPTIIRYLVVLALTVFVFMFY